VEAAKLTSLVRYSLRSAAVRHRDPAQVMVEVDAAIRADSLNGARFAMVCYFDIDTTDETVVRWARARHPFPILLDIDGKSNYCSGAEGPPLGEAGLLESVGRFCANTEQTTSLVSHVSSMPVSVSMFMATTSRSLYCARLDSVMDYLVICTRSGYGHMRTL
jgi:hypothetical protein